LTPFLPRRILATLAEGGVDCIVIGGVASAAHGSIRATQDLGVLCRNDAANLVHIAAALSRLQAKVKGSRQPPQPITPALLEGVRLMTFETAAGEIDVFFHVPGMTAYDDLASRAVAMEMQGRAVRVVSLRDLIGLKRATGRPIDAVIADELEQLEELERLEPPSGPD
jgi:hypothetical protein